MLSENFIQRMVYGRLPWSHTSENGNNAGLCHKHVCRCVRLQVSCRGAFCFWIKQVPGVGNIGDVEVWSSEAPLL